MRFRRRKPVLAPDDVQLVHDGASWTLSFGRYRIRVRACTCDLPPCTCRRARARDQWARTHHQRYCHAGHSEHMAVLYRRAVNTVGRGAR